AFLREGFTLHRRRGASLKPGRQQSSLLKSGNTGGRDFHPAWRLQRKFAPATTNPPFSPRPNECEAVNRRKRSETQGAQSIAATTPSRAATAARRLSRVHNSVSGSIRQEPTRCAST